MIFRIISFEKMLKLYIKFMKREATNDDIELLKYNIESSCCLNEVMLMKLNVEAQNILGNEEWDKTYDSNRERDLL